MHPVARRVEVDRRERSNRPLRMDITREMIAYGLIAMTIAIVLPWLAVVWVRRKRQKLRRQGIKAFGH